jgi:Tfp pilus assembly protein PilV
MELRKNAAGFSMIEALIAAAILLIIALGLLPLFSRAINDNVSGNDATQATNGSRTQLEELLQVPFNNTRLEVPGGAAQLQVADFWTRGNARQTGSADEGWWANPSGHGSVLWRRITRVRQYHISDLQDGKLDTPQPGGSPTTAVTFKEIEVVIENPKQGLFGNGQGITLRVIKPF